ncbi:MAG: hypothetical protein ACRYG5_14930 [Janthinobacterium lividum]
MAQPDYPKPPFPDQPQDKQPGSAIANTTSVNADMPSPGVSQPAELAAVYVLLASEEASYISGATVAVTGGKPIMQRRATLATRATPT